MIWIRNAICGLGPQRADQIEDIWRWEQDPHVLRGMGRQTPESLDGRTEGWNVQMRGTEHSIRFMVYDLTGNEPKPVGTTALVIDHAVRTAEFFTLIGDAANRGRGIGTEATRLTLDYAFHITALRCVHLAVLEPNTSAIRAYEKAGFRKIGTRRHSGYWLGQVCDEVTMDAIPEEFTGPSVIKSLAEGSG